MTNTFGLHQVPCWPANNESNKEKGKLYNYDNSNWKHCMRWMLDKNRAHLQNKHCKTRKKRIGRVRKEENRRGYRKHGAWIGLYPLSTPGNNEITVHLISQLFLFSLILIFFMDRKWFTSSEHPSSASGLCIDSHHQTTNQGDYTDTSSKFNII